LNYDQKGPRINQNLTIENLSQAIFIVNRHAKTATNPKLLYKLKQETLKKLLEEGKAKNWVSIFLKIREIASNSQMYLLSAEDTPSIFLQLKQTFLIYLILGN
jgi:precorrin-4 methylase